MNQVNSFTNRINKALGKKQLQNNFRSAMNYLMDKRLAKFPDYERLQISRHKSNTIRTNSVSNIKDLLILLEKNLVRNGIKVHWAENGNQANEIIQSILTKADAKKVVKGKSMVSEEIELNEYLIENGFEILETDLGEFLIQLSDDKPSHIVMPAIHKNKFEIARTFSDNFPDLKYTEDVDELTQQARLVLREKFSHADAGISGVNFAVAETGTLCLVENEGNGRMCTTVPDLHIAITGIEKVVEKLENIPPLFDILPKSATGQECTTYFNMISGPRKKDEKDGPSEVHLVLLDNGRSRVSRDNSINDILSCIRCGSCINHCPVYVKLGGHAYGTVYPGPVGIVFESLTQGLDKTGALTSACTMCGACEQVCPVKIPLPTLINRLRNESIEGVDSDSILGKGSLKMPIESGIWKVWRFIYSNPLVYLFFIRAMTRMRLLVPTKFGKWSKYRNTPKPSKRSIEEIARSEGFINE
jgi:L-lactate dehydrogenase complex protein LldF